MKEEIEKYLTDILKQKYEFVEFPTPDHKSVKLASDLINTFDREFSICDKDTFVPYFISNPEYNPDIDWYEANKSNIVNLLQEIDITLDIESCHSVRLTPPRKDGKLNCFIQFKRKQQ